MINIERDVKRGCCSCTSYKLTMKSEMLAAFPPEYLHFTGEGRAVKIAAVVLRAAGICRYDDVSKCSRIFSEQDHGERPGMGS